jgi:ADP-ribose pyrophosphatase YjhB (NUDIX family)
MLVFAVRLIVEKDGKMLFLHQTKQNGGGFSLVGGNVEDREFAREALAREAKEEAGISIVASELQLVHVLHRHKLKKNEQSLVLYFKTVGFEGDPEPLERKKFRDVVWLPTDALPDNVSKATRHVLDNLKRGEIYSEFPSRKKVLSYWSQFSESWSARLPDY